MSKEARTKLLGVNSEEFIAQLGPEERELFRQIDLSLDIESWLAGHPVGKFIAAMIDVERSNAVEALVQAMKDAPGDHERHRKEHMRIALCDMVSGWLGDAIALGRQAEAELKAREHQDA